MQVFLEFFFTHLETIIMSLAIIAFTLGGTYILYNVFFAKTISLNQDNARDIEELLKKVLAQANSIGSGKVVIAESKTENISSTEPSLSVSQPVLQENVVNSAELNSLKQQLEDKQKEIEELKNTLQKSSSEELSEDLLDKIKDLESRLAEYEIIEDDIADLSKYKEENAQLKEELEFLRSGGDDSSKKKQKNLLDDETDEPSDEVVLDVQDKLNEEIESDAITEDLINEFEHAVNEQLGLAAEMGKEKEEHLAEEIGEEVEVADLRELPRDENVNVEDRREDLFEQVAVELQETQSNGSSENEAHASYAKMENSERPGADDIFGEFVSEQVAAKATSSVDTNKMLEEMSVFENLQVQNDEEVSSFEQELDVEKMANEAQNLSNKG